MSCAGEGREPSGGEPEGIDPRVAAAAIRDAIDALEAERPDLAERLRELIAQIEKDAGPEPGG